MKLHAGHTEIEINWAVVNERSVNACVKDFHNTFYNTRSRPKQFRLQWDMI
jgi:hypothetical protein